MAKEIQIPRTNPKLVRPDETTEPQDGSLWISVAITYNDGTRTRPKRVPVEVRSHPGGVACYAMENPINFPNPEGKTAAALWYFLNGVPWHVALDWNFEPGGSEVSFDGAVVEL